ncbi:MAG: ABC transporter, permease protein 1 (cluster 1, maltose/g3p/polyamine/iron) [Candidatus Rifleibacterium amylolyticum]|nr:MAG: ABC transporter, permease protein 1 (cluster 1, maltose/g3p/polyamine/iron) [Candidatus Rifleibacterium amylolyticum]NLF96745.1 extracellular solute-binding protein [Candidatus Riflebacteria bacterium]
MKNITALLVLLLVFTTGFSQAADSESPVSLTVWAMGNEGLLIRKMADRFEKLHPQVKIITQAIPWTAAHGKLVTGVVGDMSPDVCQMGTTWMAEFQAMGALEPLDNYLQGATAVKIDDYFPAALTSTSFAGQRFGLPWYVDTRVFFYRSDIVMQAGYEDFPTDWEGLKGLATAIMAANEEAGRPGFAFSLPTNDWQIFLMFFWQAGGQLFPEGEPLPLLSQNPGEKALEYLRSFFVEGLASLTSGRDMDLLTAFDSGFFPMFIAGPWMVSTIETGKPELAGRWTTAPMPEGARSASFIGGSNLAMFKSSKNKAWAWKFMEFMSTAENQVAWYELSKNLPSLRGAWEHESLAANQHLKAFRAQLDAAIAPPAIPEWEQIADSVSEGMEPVMYGQLTAAEGLQKMSEKAAVILHKPVKTAETGDLWKLALALAFGTVLLLAAFFRWWPREKDYISNRSFQPVALVFVLPALTLLTVFLFLPILASWFASFTNWDIYGISRPENVVWTGLDNYRHLAADPVFWVSLRNSMLFALIGVPLNLMCSLFAALLLNREFIRFKALFRVGFFIPCITTMVAVAVIWRWLYNPEFGLLNLALGWLGLSPQNWLADQWLALPALIVMAVWKGFGYNMIIFIAALQSIPEELYESADIDGASEPQQFWHITLPMLRETTVFVTIMTSIGFLQFFAEPYVMTGGGPLNQTMSVVLYMYNHGFKFYNLGYASSIAYVLFALILTFTLAQGLMRKSLEGGRK